MNYYFKILKSNSIFRLNFLFGLMFLIMGSLMALKLEEILTEDKRTSMSNYLIVLKFILIVLFSVLIVSVIINIIYGIIVLLSSIILLVAVYKVDINFYHHNIEMETIFNFILFSALVSL